ncbi:hypothetical protein P7M41_12340 [Vibrio parahaemolyticus]|uniref:hypothetical protein n=1 Tax=Vibrio parahaemolyticus TaxID=670 RepID=UPI001268EEA5|nr:hypothetical protein [Vibrio parahaemolyticus]MDF4257163.1 hypothetical protein [Vibrio parahaemolyticus]MDF4262355.1 hypothetical protein [Vibrio parahaemolyticus]MDG2552823.1 hypothetical protein [Vibrio parahaemolyticus]MEA5303191.1 hypothetical protein [Vibrio parahaemolyticus]
MQNFCVGRYPSGKAFRLTPRIDNLNHDIERARCGSKFLSHNPERLRYCVAAPRTSLPFVVPPLEKTFH